jgi:hypothetical protein
MFRARNRTRDHPLTKEGYYTRDCEIPWPAEREREKEIRHKGRQKKIMAQNYWTQRRNWRRLLKLRFFDDPVSASLTAQCPILWLSVLRGAVMMEWLKKLPHYSAEDIHEKPHIGTAQSTALRLHNCTWIITENVFITDRLCGLVVRVLGYRSGGPGSIPGTTRIKKSSGSGTGSTQPR